MERRGRRGREGGVGVALIGDVVTFRACVDVQWSVVSGHGTVTCDTGMTVQCGSDFYDMSV